MEKKSGSRSKAKKTGAATSPKPRTRRAAGSVSSNGAAAEAGLAVTPEERHQLIAEAAYYRAVRRNFADGDELEDWLAAEAEVAVRLDGRGHAPSAGSPPS